MNPLAWAGAIAIVIVAVALFMQASRMRNIHVGVQGIEASLNGHPSNESLGQMVYDTRAIVRDHIATPIDKAHPPAQKD